MAGAIAACFAGLALLRRLGVGEWHAWLGFWLLGLASPLTIYALDFWEHTLGVGLMAWAVVLIVDIVGGTRTGHRGWIGAAAAGVLFGASATMRTESLVYLAVSGAAVVIVPWISSRPGRQDRPDRKEIVRSLGHAGALGAAAAVPLLANGLLERNVIGVGIRSARVAGTAIGIGDAAGSRLHEGAITLLALDGSPLGLVLGGGVLVLLVFASLRRDLPAAVVAVAGAAVLTALRFVIAGLGFVPGLGPAWVLPPAVTGAIGRGRFGMSDPSRPDVRRVLLLVVALGAAPLVLATQFRGGAGPQWAGRYLLVSGFLLAVVGWAALERRPPILRGAFAALALGTTAFGVTWLSVRSHDVDRTIATLERRPEPVLLSGVYFLAREGGATYGDHRWLTLSLNPGGTTADAARVLTEAGVATFATVEYDGAKARTFAGFRPTSATRLTLFDGVDLQITSWRRSP
jgi:hypothetical protein